MNNTSKRFLLAAKDEVQSSCIYIISCRECPAEHIGKTSRQLMTWMSQHRRGKCRLSDKATLSKIKRHSAIPLHATAEGHSTIYEKTRLLQLEFKTCTESKYAEAFVISACSICIIWNKGADLSKIWAVLTDVPKVTFLADLTTTAAHNVKDNGFLIRHTVKSIHRRRHRQLNILWHVNVTSVIRLWNLPWERVHTVVETVNCTYQQRCVINITSFTINTNI